MRYHDDDSFTGLDHAKRGQAAPGHRGTWAGPPGTGWRRPRAVPTRSSKSAATATAAGPP